MKSEEYRFYALVSRMRYITRWGLMRNTFSENVQEHSHMVAVLAHGLALKVVAEGVEDQQQLDFLRGEQCDEVQGYLISPPMRAEGLADLLRKNADFS